MDKTTRNKLDRVFSEYKRLSESDENGYGRCISCGKTVYWTDADCGHYVNRKHLSLRWSETNCHLQCRSCNRFDEGNLPAYTLALQKKYGDDIVSRLLAAKNIIVKYSNAEGLAMIAHYTKEVNALRKQKGL